MYGAGLVALGTAVIAGLARWRCKHPWSEIRRLLLLAPRGWPFWWPRRWSPPGVAERLPRNIARWRKAMGACVALLLGVAVPATVAVLYGPRTGPWREVLRWIWLTASNLAGWSYFGVGLYATRWGTKHGLTQQENAQLLHWPLASAFWRKPRVAALLRALWLQLASLRALKTADDPEAGEVTGRIRALCGSVALEISAEHETARLLESNRS